MRTILALVLAAAAMAVVARGELAPEEKARIEALIGQMGDNAFAVREEATRQLIALGADVLPMVRKKFEETDDPELSMRCDRVLREVRLPERAVKDFGERPAGLAQLMHSNNRETLIFRVARGGKTVLIHEGKESPPYDALREYHLTNDPNRVVYIAMSAAGYHAVVDDRNEVYELAAFPRVSPDGKHVAYLAESGGRKRLVLDGNELPSYVHYVGMNFTTDSRFLVTAAQRGEQWVLAVNASETPAHERVFPVALSDVPRYVAIDGEEAWLCRAEVPAKDGPLPPQLVETKVRKLAQLDAEYAKRGPAVSGSTEHCVVLAAVGAGNSRVYCDGRLVGAYDSCGAPLFSTDGAHLAVVMQKPPEVRSFVVWDDKELGPYQAVGPVVFSPDGRRLAFGARRDGQWFVVLDGKEWKPNQLQPTSLVFSPDGKRLAALFSSVYTPDGHRFVPLFGTGLARSVVLDDEEVGRYTKTGSGFTGAVLAFSPDGRHLAWVGGRGNEEFVVCDGREGMPWRGVESLRFSDDGRHLCCAVLTSPAPAGPPMRCMVVDGIACPSSETIVGPSPKQPLDRLRYVTFRDNHYKLVEVAWPKSFDWTNGLKALQQKP
jgi:hypothetical protein